MDKITDFLQYAGKLKSVKRKGWFHAGIKNPESVAEHSFGVSILAMVLSSKLHLNETKLIKMALIHDLAESVVGDKIVERGSKVVASQSKKFEKEKKAMEKICSNLEKGDEYYKLWIEFENQSSKEAKMLKQLDKLEMAVQALEYGKKYPKKLNEFWINAEKHVKDKELKKILKQLKGKRKVL